MVENLVTILRISDDKLECMFKLYIYFFSVHRVLLPDAKVYSPPINQETEVVRKSDKACFIILWYCIFIDNVKYLLFIIYHNKHKYI